MVCFYSYLLSGNSKFLILSILTLFLFSCKLPEDPQSTLQNVLNSHTLKIGLCPTIGDQKVTQLENHMLEKLAAELQTKISWIVDNQENLYRKLEKNELNIVSCNIHADSPWKDQLAFTIPFEEIKDPTTNTQLTSFVFAVKQGENRWLSFINKFINNYKVVAE